MKKTIEGKRYNTDKCEKIGDIDHYNNGNYSGSTTLLLAKNGTYLVHTNSNGQDLFFEDNLCEWDKAEESIDDFYLSETQENRCIELGLIEIVE